MAAGTAESLTLITASGEHAFTIEVADTPSKQQRGLMFRRSLGEREGMLFVHDRPREIVMWMRNTYISLDMIFLTADGTVHRIERDTEPFSERRISSRGPVSAVLEVNAGMAARIGLRPGDRARHRYFDD